MQTEQSAPIRNHYVQKTARILIKVVLFLLLFAIILFLLVLTPPVQRFATTRVENYLEKKLKTKVEIGSIRFSLDGDVNLQDVYIEDLKKDTLLAGGLIKANVDFLKLFSNEVKVTDLHIKDITARIKRVLPDTVFNFQFIVDAFVTQKTNTDTATTPPLKIALNDLLLENINVVLNDVITGSDMFLKLGRLNAKIDTLDPYLPHFDVPLLFVNNLTARIRQNKPLAEAESTSKDLAEATGTVPMKLNFGKIDLGKIDVQYDNAASAIFSHFIIGRLLTEGKLIDLQNRHLHFGDLQLIAANSEIKLGRKEAARVVEKEIEKEIEIQKQKAWSFRIDRVRIDDNSLKFDNDNKPKQGYGMDYAHLHGEDFNLHIEDFVLNTDSIGGQITKGSFREKSGFVLNALQADVLYANNQSYLKNLYLKTPGTELKRNAYLEYASYDALIDNFPQTNMDIELVNSYVQVKDILTFAPQLRSQAAFRNPADVWHLNIDMNGNVNRLHFNTLQFSGLKNTEIDASGTLAGLTNPNSAGGTFTIRRLHTSQSDIALFTGKRLLTPDVNLPETFTASGTLSGNTASLATNLKITTSAGSVGVNGSFSNLMNPDALRYNARVTTSGLQLGSILKGQQDIGALSGSFSFSGAGISPATINTKFTGNIYSFGYNNYNYRNVTVKGSLKKTVFDITADSKDPNADLTITASGNFSNNASFKIDGFVDSLKTLPLHLTTQPVVFRGKIEGDVASLNPDYLEGNLLISDALLVSNNERLTLDSVLLVSGRSDTGQYIRLTSAIANAQIAGKYRLADLGKIIQHNIQPYFSVAPYSQLTGVQPYDFNFYADVAYTPILSALVPGLKTAEAIHAEGRMATNEGLRASANTPFLVFQNNELHNLNLNVNTTDSGMYITGNVGHLISGNSLDVYNVQVDALVKNNVIDFNLGIDDKNGNDKYRIGGILTQPSQGDFTIQLKPGNLLLNYDQWTVSPGNSISIVNGQVVANNFTLQKGDQQLTMSNVPGGGIQPLNLTFTNFQIGTITGFLKSDSLLINGSMNGTITFRDLLKQPVFTSDLTINDFSFRQDTVGNVNLKVSSAGDRYITNATITGRGNDLAITGSFAPQDSNDIALDLELAIRNIEMKTLEGAFADFIKSASGSINGNVAIKGTTSSPDIKGTINFDTTTISTKLLGGPLTIDNESLTVTQNGFALDNFIIRDSANNTLALNGNVQTNNFINYYFDVDVDATNFRVLNTTKKDNKIYYGQLVISSDVHIAGTERSPIVDGAITIVDGTDFTVVVPQAEPGVIERDGIVAFSDFDSPENDSLFLTDYDSLNVSDITGFDIAANIEVKKEAKFNLVLDAANGDFVNVQGEALLSTGIDPSGKVTLVGTYEIDRGAYEISFNFIRRRFEIQKGSRLVWMGEPTDAQVDVTGIYVANTAPLDLVDDQISASTATIRNTYLQKLPFQVHLKMTGELMKPQISFDLQLPPGSYNVSGDILTHVETRLTQLRQDEGELNKQVFSLLLLNRFVSENPFESSGDGFSASSYAKQSVSRLLTEQLNRLASGLIDGVDLTFDVSNTDDYTTGERRSRTDLNVGLSKRLLNERLTVTVGSNFELEGPQRSNQRSNSFADNIAVNYQLSRDGKYMLRAYRKNEYQGAIDGYIIETGLTFTVTLDYDHFRDLFRRKKKVEGVEEPKTDSTNGK